MRRMTRPAVLLLVPVLIVTALAVWSRRTASVFLDDKDLDMEFSESSEEIRPEESMQSVYSSETEPDEGSETDIHDTDNDENESESEEEESAPESESEADESGSDTEDDMSESEPDESQSREESESSQESSIPEVNPEPIPDVEQVQDILYTETEDWVLVESFQALLSALNDGKNRIRLTQDIALESSIRLTQDLVLDGLREDDTYCTITERHKGISHTFRLNATGLNISIQNMNIMGYDHFGFVSQLDTNAAGSDCTVTYENVRYTGPQLAWLRYNGRLVLRDCEIDLMKNTGGNDAGELGECTQFVLGGNTRVTKHEGTDSMFWIFNHNTGGEGLLEIEDDSHVELEHKVTYLTYREPGGNGVNRYSFVVGDNSVLHMKTKLGWCYYLTQYFDDMTIGINSTVTMHRESETIPGDYYNLLIKDSLRIGQGSSFVVESQRPIIYLGLGSVVEMDNPEEIRLEMSMKGNAPAQITIRAKAFNQWTRNDVAGPPDRILNAPYGELITLSWSGGSASASWIDEVTGLPVVRNDVDDLIPYMKTELKRFVAGDYGLEADEMTVYSTAITGAMESSIRLVLSFFAWDADVSDPGNRMTRDAVWDPAYDRNDLEGFVMDPQLSPDPTGYGSFARNEEIWFDVVKTIAHEDSMLERETLLYAREERILPDSGRLYIVRYPELLQFGTHKIPNLQQTVPVAEDSELVVYDSRKNPEEAVWNLTVKSGSFRNDTADSRLDADTIGFLREGEFTGLKNGVSIWQSTWEEDGEEHILKWKALDLQDGFAVRIGPDSSRADEYRAVITWTLSVGPA